MKSVGKLTKVINQSTYSIIDKTGKETSYIWCQEQRKFIKTEIDKKMTAVIYSNGSQECERMGMLLKALGGEYHEYLLGVDFSDKQFRMEFGSEATYPQCAIGNKHIGNLKETLHYLDDKGMLL